MNLKVKMIEEAPFHDAKWQRSVIAKGIDTEILSSIMWDIMEMLWRWMVEGES